MRALTFVVIAAFATTAAADLYRWVDPETGSVKFSSYPPPWYGDPEKSRRAPKVEHIPAGMDPTAKPASAKTGESGRRLEILEVPRKTLLLQLPKLAAESGTEPGAQALKRQMEIYATLTDQMDKLDPEGAAARRAEMQAQLDKAMRGESR